MIETGIENTNGYKKGYAKALRDVRGLAHKVDDNSFTVYYSDLEELKKKGGSE